MGGVTSFTACQESCCESSSVGEDGTALLFGPLSMAEDAVKVALPVLPPTKSQLLKSLEGRWFLKSNSKPLCEIWNAQVGISKFRGPNIDSNKWKGPFYENTQQKGPPTLTETARSSLTHCPSSETQCTSSWRRGRTVSVSACQEKPSTGASRWRRKLTSNGTTVRYGSSNKVDCPAWLQRMVARASTPRTQKGVAASRVTIEVEDGTKLPILPRVPMMAAQTLSPLKLEKSKKRCS